LAVRGNDNFCSTVQNLRGVRHLSLLMVTHLATVTDGHMILFRSFCCKCTSVDNSRRTRKDKFDIVSENQQQNTKIPSLLAGSGRPNQNPGRNFVINEKIFYFENLLIWVTACFSFVFAGEDRSRSIIRSTALGMA